MDRILEFAARVVNIYYINGLATVGLLFLCFTFNKVFEPRDRGQSAFFSYLGFGWCANLVYLGYLDASKHFTFGEFNEIVILELNVMNYFFFLLACRWQLNQSFGWLSAQKVIVLVAIGVGGLPLINYFLFNGLTKWVMALAEILGFLSIAMVGLNYHLYFNRTKERIDITAKVLLVVSAYSYSILQFASFLLPPYSDILPTNIAFIGSVPFAAGMILKLLHIFGLIQYGKVLFSEYQRQTRMFLRAKLCRDITDQLSHELQTPALELKVRLENMVEDWNDDNSRSGRQDEARLAKELQDSISLLEQLTGLVDIFQQFLRSQDFEKFASADDSTTIATRLCNMNVICDAAILSLKLTLKPRVRFVKRYCSGPTVMASELELVQIMRNLVKNAIEELESIERIGYIKKIRVETAIDGDKDKVEVRVSDNGGGVRDDNMLETIFEDGFTTKTGVGRGHGLFIAKTLAEKNGGELGIEKSTKKRVLIGACFLLTLPLCGKAAKKEIGDRNEHNVRR